MFGAHPPLFHDAQTVRRWTIGLIGIGIVSALVLEHLWPEGQLVLAVALIAAVGLQHGALDHILHAHMHGDPEGPLRQSFALPYIAAIGLCWVAFEWAPPVMLGVFLLASAYHFGMSHLRVDAMAGRSTATRIGGLVMGLAILAPLITRPDALTVLRDFGWDLDAGFGGRNLPLQLTSASALILAATLHATWRNGLLAVCGVVLAWCVDDLLLAFALYFAIAHSREAFFEEFQERQSTSTSFGALYLRSIPLTVAFAIMAAAVLWSAQQAIISERTALSFLLAGTLPHIAVLEGWVTARLR